MLHDLRFAIRSLRKSAGFASVAALTLALGIGANTAVFSVVNGVLLRPLPFHDQDRLFMLMEQNRAGRIRLLSYPDFLDWQSQTSDVADIAYVRGQGERITTTDGVQSTIASFVSPGFFGTLDEHPLTGRLFSAEEEHAGTHVAVLSYALWQALFGGDPHIVGRALTLSEGVFTIVGVLPHDVAYPPWADAQVYLPIQTIVATEPALAQRGFRADSRVIARLKAGVTVERATAGLGTVARREAAAYPDLNTDWTAVRLIPLRNEILGGNTARQLLVLLAAVGLVLLIACVNVANLTLARAGARGREIAIRLSLGAGRGRVMRQLVAESLILAVTGAALGVLVATWAIALLKRSAGAVVPRLATVHVSGAVLAFTIGVMTLAAALTGLVPAIHSARPDLTRSLNEGTGRAGSGRESRRLRATLVTAEIALAVILVVGAGLLVKSLSRLRAVDPGFDPQGVVTFYMDPPASETSNPAKLAALYQRVEDAVRALPGVTDVALTNFLPLSGGWLPSPVEIPGRAPDPEHDPQVLFMTASPDYFHAMRIPLRAGRAFTDADLAGGTAVLANEAFVRAFWPDQDPIGRVLTLHKAAQGRPDFGEPLPSVVVGVVGDVRHFGLDTPPTPEIYVPYTRNVWGHMTLVARTPEAPEQLVATLRRVLRRVAPELPITLSGGRAAVGTINVGSGLTSRRFDTYVLGAFAAAALALAAIGVYGLLAYAVAQRRREIAVRAALGATSSEIRRLIVGEGMRLAGAGIVLGIIAGLFLTRLLRTLLYDVGASDPVTFAIVTGLLAVVAWVACYLPARRATRIDPMEALRYE
jgi:putative ABC transport system permease protein